MAPWSVRHQHRRRAAPSGWMPATEPRPTLRTRSKNEGDGRGEATHRRPGEERGPAAAGRPRGHTNRVAAAPRPERRPEAHRAEDAAVPTPRGPRPDRAACPLPDREDPRRRAWAEDLVKP